MSFDRSRLTRWLVDHWPILSLVAFTAVLHRSVLHAMPATGDHMIHLFKNWHMAEHMIPSGRVTGWSHLMFAGYPSGVYYPILGDLYASAVHFLSFGLLSWQHTYQLAFFGLLLLVPLTVYVLARRFLGPLPSFFAGLFAVGDVGGWPQGGHLSTVYWAVWPFVLGVSFCILAVAAFERALDARLKDDPSRLIGFVALLALAVLGHPMSVVFLAWAGPLFVLAYLFFKRREARPLPTLGKATLAALLALALTAFWVVPWVTTGEAWSYSWPAVGFGGPWVSLPKLVRELFTNRLFHGFSRTVWFIGGAGIVLGLVSRRLWPTYLAVLIVALLLFVGLGHSLGDGLLFRKVQIERVAAYQKAIWFVLAGYAIERGAALALVLWARFVKRWPWDARRRLFRLLPHLATVVAAVIFVTVTWSQAFSVVAKTRALGGPIWRSIVTAERWLAGQERGPLDRVLYQAGPRCVDGNLSSSECNEVYHRHLFASGPIRTGLPKLRFGYEATAIYHNLPLPHRWPKDTKLIQLFLSDPRALANLHVRWIVSLEPWPARSDYRLVRSFDNNVWVYEVLTGREPPVRVEGPGRVVVERFADEHVALRVVGATAGTRLVFPISHYYPWHAYQDGRPIPIETAGIVGDVRRVLISVRPGNGRVELRYERPPAERIANWTSFLGWLGLVAGVGWMTVGRWFRARRQGPG